jgi:hypothetical protein
MEAPGAPGAERVLGAKCPALSAGPKGSIKVSLSFANYPLTM